MNNFSLQTSATGFALTEALCALLLLAAATGSAGSAMLEAMAGQRSALRRTIAANLAADLAEALRAAPDAASMTARIGSWQEFVQQQLPGAVALVVPRPPSTTGPAALPSGFNIQLQWRDGRASAPAQFTLPVSLDAGVGR